ncbi:MAG: hypothetical protein E4H19_12775 [Chromatiales bacterium]|nr:MAG: hypothetical protein E4H19_12775 [Chromatiales bacterium]
MGRSYGQFRDGQPADEGREITVRLVSCGTPNACWDPGARQLRFCHELLEAFDKLSVDSTVSRAYDALLKHENILLNSFKSHPRKE